MGINCGRNQQMSATRSFIRWFAACLLLCGLQSVHGAPAVVKLDDTNFEGQTQAATGQTTGIWVVHFRGGSCQECDVLSTALHEFDPEAGSGGVVLAEVDVDSSPGLRKRFSIDQLPTVLLFRNRKMYKYSGSGDNEDDILSDLLYFAKDGYSRSAVPLDVPKPGSLVTNVLQQAKEFVSKPEGFFAVVLFSMFLSGLVVWNFFRGLSQHLDKED